MSINATSQPESDDQTGATNPTAPTATDSERSVDPVFREFIFRELTSALDEDHVEITPNENSSIPKPGLQQHSKEIWGVLANLGRDLPRGRLSSVYRRKLLAEGYRQPLDRVNELSGHTGCVNALSWAHDGDLLLSGGDDTTVRLWRMAPETDGSQQYPFKCDAVIHTPHTGNIFNAQLLPGSSRIATVAGDGRVCVFDAERAITTPVHGRETDFSQRETCIRVFRCHKGRTKRIVTEGSPDLFLTVAEDNTVRQHDLRIRHQCSGRNCPPPLLKLPHELTTLALSPLTPYQFVVAGESPYGYLFDRRQTGRMVEEEWGVPCVSEDAVTCVRRFGRPHHLGSDPVFDHITGARMAQSNGQEVLLSYSSDAVYLYSTLDNPTNSASKSSSVVKPNSTRRRARSQPPSAPVGSSRVDDEEEIENSHDHDEEEEEEEEEEESLDDQLKLHAKHRAPVILPRARYAGARNCDTVKDVNFIGPNDEFVSSGSDDGNFFLWNKTSREIHGIYEGDGSVVNVVEGHPRLPLLAVSGIDTTIKLFAPTISGPNRFSRLAQKDQIVERNTTRSRMHSRFALRHLLQQYQLARMEAESDGGDGEGVQCTYQ